MPDAGVRPLPGRGQHLQISGMWCRRCNYAWEEFACGDWCNLAAEAEREPEQGDRDAGS
jgi:hypothetical protein